MTAEIVQKRLNASGQPVHSPPYEQQRLPDRWSLVKFDDVAESTDFVANGSFASLRENVKYEDEPDYAILVRLTDFTKHWQADFVYVDRHAYEFLAKSSLKPGDVVVANVGDPGRVFRVPNLGRPMTLGPNSVLIKTRKGLEQGFISYFLMSPWGQDLIARITTGTAQKKFNKTGLRSLVIPIAPPNEQKSIVAEIEKQFSRLDEAVANLKRYKASVLKAAVEGKLTSTEKPWKQAKLGEIATSIRNGYSKKPDAERGTRIFRISAVRPMDLDANDVRYLSGVPSNYEPFLVGSGDVLFTRYNGSRDYVGVCARVPVSLPPTVYPDKLIRVRVPDSMLLPEFLVILASTGRAREYVESKIRTTAGQSGISGGDLKALPLDIPRVEEQQRIVDEVERRLSIIEELEAAVEANLTRADRLRQSILSQAFSGRLNS